MSEIKPCPFCKEAEDIYLHSADDFAHWVTCLGCEADGPSAESGPEAIALWNEAPRVEPLPISQVISNEHGPLSRHYWN